MPFWLLIRCSCNENNMKWSKRSVIEETHKTRFSNCGFNRAVRTFVRLWCHNYTSAASLAQQSCWRNTACSGLWTLTNQSRLGVKETGTKMDEVWKARCAPTSGSLAQMAPIFDICLYFKFKWHTCTRLFSLFSDTWHNLFSPICPLFHFALHVVGKIKW